MYRPPSSNISYFSSIVNDIEKVVSEDYKVIILGDFNYDLLNNDGSFHKNVILLEQLFDLKQLIHSPTRVTPMTQTIMDHILVSSYINKPNNLNGVLEINLSDHYAAFCVLDIQKGKLSSRIIRCRNFKHLNQDFFYL